LQYCAANCLLLGRNSKLEFSSLQAIQGAYSVEIVATVQFFEHQRLITLLQVHLAVAMPSVVFLLHHRWQQQVCQISFQMLAPQSEASPYRYEQRKLSTTASGRKVEHVYV
jgi:hypothetical protein